jgi:transposase-like protein
MPKPDVRGELIRAVQQDGESVAVAAMRLGVPVSTAYQWKRSAVAKAASATTSTPMFVEVVAERATRSTMLIRIGAAEIEVRVGFDAHLLREVVDALGGES